MSKIIQKSVRQTALDIYRQIDKTMPDLTGMLCNQYQVNYNKHYNGDRLQESWNNYCVSRDVFLQHLGKINLESELRQIDNYPKK